MSKVLLGAVGVLVLQALLVLGYLSMSHYDPIVLDPSRGGLIESGFVMTAYCGDGSGKGMLTGLPANGRWDSWTKGRTVRVGKADCTVWYHQHEGYSPCDHPGYTFDRGCPKGKEMYAN